MGRGNSKNAKDKRKRWFVCKKKGEKKSDSTNELKRETQERDQSSKEKKERSGSKQKLCRRNKKVNGGMKASFSVSGDQASTTFSSWPKPQQTAVKSGLQSSIADSINVEKNIVNITSVTNVNTRARQLSAQKVSFQVSYAVAVDEDGQDSDVTSAVSAMDSSALLSLMNANIAAALTNAGISGFTIEADGLEMGSTTVEEEEEEELTDEEATNIVAESDSDQSEQTVGGGTVITSDSTSRAGGVSGNGNVLNLQVSSMEMEKNSNTQEEKAPVGIAKVAASSAVGKVNTMGGLVLMMGAVFVF